ncbi:MAG: phosphoglycerate kinase [Gammaproteobacteria bacterium RIFCSPHIGHO2_12_FULL_35_23]|nr:MAG: phosphoglycerate kinase [Gammaproteobacteria bacterium RIFCSPHIGHO2_12_FULL_35_23]
MTIIEMSEMNLKGKRVLIREDLNVPIKDGKVTSDARIKAAIPTIQQALKAGAAVMILSHLGRPTAGKSDPELSLQPVADCLSKLLKKPVRFIVDWLKGVEVKPGEVVLFENVRFNVGEKENEEGLAKKMAALCDVFVMDAFATAHRAEASTAGVSQFAKIACAGPLLMQEIETLEKVLKKPKRPLIAVVGGAKVSTKLSLLDSLADKVDALIVGGGIANTFIAANGYDVGSSLYEADLIDEAERIMTRMKQRKASLPIPSDVVVAEHMTETAEAYDENVDQVADDEKILDIGPETAKIYVEIIKKAGTILWNGPLGAFEIEQFAKGTEVVAKAIATSKALSVAGGGDTIAAIDKYGLTNKISYISTGGGAFLAFIEGKELPALTALKQHKRENNGKKAKN